ncbi:MAG: 2-hydroxychromene-2-carboxylate isomerase [Pseudomonadota bacterium]|nr:2-hydroxychromene-2-carboxylate isomerase [Pseudomonadota bacterium]
MSTTPVWYFDFISPFAYLQWPKIKALMEEREVVLHPIVFAAVLAERGQKGPAEIPGKREFTYRHALWLARARGMPLKFPPAHPFNPIAALRLCMAAGSSVAAVDALFDWIWTQGRNGDSLAALAPVIHALGVDPAVAGEGAIKRDLRANTDAALAAGVFGVPTLAIGPHLFWGQDAHEFAMAVLHDPDVLTDPEMQRLGRLPVGVSRG